MNELVLPENKDWATPEAIDLLNKLLKFDFSERITSLEALQHPYFDSVRSKFE